MPRHIIKIRDDKFGLDYYLEWSTVVDAPVSYGMTLEEFKDYYGREDTLLPDRLKRVEEKGTSSLIDENIDDIFEYNRAGENETMLDKEGILNKYCRGKI